MLSSMFGSFFPLKAREGFGSQDDHPPHRRDLVKVLCGGLSMEQGVIAVQFGGLRLQAALLPQSAGSTIST